MTATTTCSSSKNHHSSSSRPTNPISRNSEISNPMRRSFSGSPFSKPSIISSQRIGFNPNTPVNSPSDCPRRHSFSRENVVVTLREQEDKENGRDLNDKQARVRSPASSKGAKNFMSPTISAASKVNASPRKRIFAERNEQARSSVSFSDGKSPLVSKPQKEVSFVETVTYLGDEDHEHLDSSVPSGKEDDCVHFDAKPCSVTVDKDSVNLDPSFEISPKGPCYWTRPALAPLDADPSMPPYDPKTNYLSPRPQFLHYRPNPRIEPYLNMEGDGQKLEERFASEISSDSEFTEEENHSDDSGKEFEDMSCDLPKEEAKEMLEEAGEEQDGELLKSESYPISVAAEPDTVSSSQRVAEPKPLSRPRFFARSANVNALLFVLAATCLWLLLANSPVMEPSVLNNLSFPEMYLPPEISKFSRHHFELAYQKIQLWLHQCSSYTWNLIIRFSERHKLVSLQYVNSSTPIENRLVGHLVFDHSFQREEPKYENNGLSPLRYRVGQPTEGDEKNIEDENIETGHENFEYYEEEEEEVPHPEELDLEEQWVQTALADDNIEASGEHENIEATDENFEYSFKEERAPESEELREFEDRWVQTALTAENIAGDGASGDNFEHSKEERIPESKVVDHADQRVQTTFAAEIQREVLDSTELEWTDESSSLDAESVLPILRSDTATENPPSSVLVGSTVDGSQSVFSAHNMVGISLLVLCVLAGFALIRIYNQKPKISNASPSMNQVAIITKKVDNSHMSVSGDRTVHERRLSSSNRQTEVDMLCEPSCCPSEMSSFRNSFSSNKVLQRSNEAHSQERTSRKNHNRRESLASSDYSMGSLSYGSFTTYEKITSKLGNGDEEVITPVRRSSRLRNHVTSP